MTTAQDNPTALETYQAGLAEYFPPKHPHTSWMLRLAIIRDDLSFEVDSLELREQHTTTDVWRVAYFLRRLSSSVSEARNVFANPEEVPSILKEPPADLGSVFQKMLRETSAALNDGVEWLRQVRDSVGIHVRPNHAKTVIPDGFSTVEEAVGAHHGKSWSARVTFGPHYEDTDFRALTACVLLYAWPDVKDRDTLDKRMREYVEKLEACVAASAAPLS